MTPAATSDTTQIDVSLSQAHVQTDYAVAELARARSSSLVIGYADTLEAMLPYDPSEQPEATYWRYLSESWGQLTNSLSVSRQVRAIELSHEPIEATTLRQMAQALSQARQGSDERASPLAIARAPIGERVNKLLLLIEHEPVEDGSAHPGDELVLEILESNPEAAANWLRSLVRSDLSPAVIAGVLRLVGRVDVLDSAARREILSRSLRHGAPAVRDAAIQAAEHWEDSGLAPVLREYRERVPWLRDYLTKVASSLESP